MANIGAIVPAAGQGKRMGGQGNKLLLKLAGTPVLLYVLTTLEQCPYISDIIIAAAEQDIPEIAELASQNNVGKVKAIVRGGKERQESVFRALQAVNPRIDRIVIHDGARPLLTVQELNAFLEQAAIYEAAIMAVRPKDTIKVTDGESWVEKTLVRDDLCAVQTPQVFDRALLEKVHKLANECGYYATDDSSLVEWQGHRVKVLSGSYENIKVTTPEDMLLAELILRRRSWLAGKDKGEES
ncbi:MAG: 2-C-methyl-D-erythritol 4-phosphate cytidylyltransferase [Peptococcaceae bacterium]|nr:2-C-methyl-D-erythritol 4-phosphate cytidylyltransferase [Peptococcaceae bacterium]